MERRSSVRAGQPGRGRRVRRGALAGAILALTVGLCAPALAAPSAPPTDPPAPRALSRADIHQWVANYIRAGADLDATQTDTMALFFTPDSVELVGESVRAAVRGELFETQPFRGSKMRSFQDHWDFDCAGQRFRIAQSDVFPQSNLQGTPIMLDMSKEQWSRSFSDGSGPAPMIAQVCSLASLLKAGLDKAKAMPPPPEAQTDEATQAWVKRYVEPGSDTLAYAGRGIAVLYTTQGLETAPDGRPLASVRTELTHLLAADDTAWRSMREQVEVDCSNRRYRGVKQEIYPGVNLTGSAVVNTDGDWTDVVEGSVSSKWFPAVCKALGADVPAPAPEGSI